MRLNLVTIYRTLYQDLGVDRCTTDYVVRRIKNEGLYFVSSVLPAFSKHVLRCLEAGYWSSFDTSIKTKGGLPVIFQGYLKQLFYYDRDRLMFLSRDLPDPVSLLVIRQACEYTYKLAVETSASPESLVENFLAVDSEVLDCGEYEHDFVDTMRKNFETHYPRSSKITHRDCAVRAHPGPGTFSGSTRDFYRRNHLPAEVNPRGSDYRFGLRLNRRSPNPTVTSSDPDYSEVLFVPKDSRGPRVIVREPYTNLLFQMGFNSQLVERLEYDTRNRINFVSQAINKDLARSSSIDRSYATIDLKEASDRVSYAIVKHVFRYTSLAKIVDSFRTKKAKLPNGDIVNLRKLSGMGSGFTFPTLALIIHLAICTQISASLKRRYKDVSQHVYVYGDDIIVPTHWYELAVIGLAKVGLCVNSSKSYRSSNFRESCGGDYLFGNDVGPTRLKLANAKPKSQAVFIDLCDRDFALLGLERHCRLLVKNQYYALAEYYYTQLEREVGPLPYVSGDSPVLGRYTDRDTVLRSLTVDPTGLYTRKSLLVARPVRRKMLDMCPYRYLLRSLNKRTQVESWQKDLIVCDRPTRFQEVTLPRRVTVKPSKMSSFIQAG